MPNQNIHDLYRPSYSYKTAAKEKCSPGSDIEKIETARTLYAQRMTLERLNSWFS